MRDRNTKPIAAASVCIAAILSFASCSNDDGANGAAPTSSVRTTVASTTTADDVFSKCRAISHLMDTLRLPAGFDTTIREGLGGGVPSSTPCSAHYSTGKADGTYVDIVEKDPPYTLIAPERIGDYEVGVVEDGLLAVYVGSSLPDHYLAAYGVLPQAMREMIDPQ